MERWKQHWTRKQIKGKNCIESRSPVSAYANGFHAKFKKGKNWEDESVPKMVIGEKYTTSERNLWAPLFLRIKERYPTPKTWYLPKKLLTFLLLLIWWHSSFWRLFTHSSGSYITGIYGKTEGTCWPSHQPCLFKDQTTSTGNSNAKSKRKSIQGDLTCLSIFKFPNHFNSTSSEDHSLITMEKLIN